MSAVLWVALVNISTLVSDEYFANTSLSFISVIPFTPCIITRVAVVAVPPEPYAVKPLLSVPDNSNVLSLLFATVLVVPFNSVIPTILANLTISPFSNPWLAAVVTSAVVACVIALIEAGASILWFVDVVITAGLALVISEIPVALPVYCPSFQIANTLPSAPPVIKVWFGASNLGFTTAVLLTPNTWPIPPKAVSFSTPAVEDTSVTPDKYVSLESL